MARSQSSHAGCGHEDSACHHGRKAGALVNKYMLIFLLLSIVLGLWSSPRARKGGMVAALTVGLVLFFLFFPDKL